MLRKRDHKRQSGAVSIFIVVFVALLVVVTTVSFMRIMLNDQQQATDSDLSQSAYDSAQAGVEDVKRALMLYKMKCASTVPDDVAACNNIKSVLSNQKCNSLVSKLGDYSGRDTTKEVKVNSGDNNDKYEQAYTCTLATLNTDDYLGKMSDDQSAIIPLLGTGSFNQIRVEWFSSKDLSNGVTNISLLSRSRALNKPLLQKIDWPSNRPPILRTQLIQFSNSGATSSSFDDGNNANTLFLYPSSGSSVNSTLLFSSARRNTATQSPSVIYCKDRLNTGSYACTVTLNLPNPVGGNLDSRVAYLRLTSLYNKANFRVTLVGTQFNGVQPEVDSTGRANDLYRRIKSRIEFTDANYPFPEAAVDINGNFCKSFIVTDDRGDYDDGGCTP